MGGKMAALLQKTEGLVDKLRPALPKVKQLKAFVDPKVKQVQAKVEPKVMQLKAKIEPKVQELMKTKQYKQACEVACKGLTFSVQTCEKVIGKEKTKSLIQAVEARIPTAWKAASPPAPTK